jgi:enoyl-CoA hydratase/carnithine racemase
MTDPYQTILLAVDDAGVASLTWNRPEALNGWNARMLGLTAPEMMEREGPLLAWAGGQPDAREGVVAFLEKREPAWKLRPSVDLPER